MAIKFLDLQPPPSTAEEADEVHWRSFGIPGDELKAVNREGNPRVLKTSRGKDFWAANGTRNRMEIRAAGIARIHYGFIDGTRILIGLEALPIVLRFRLPLRLLSIRVAAALGLNDTDSRPYHVTLEALDAAGQVLASFPRDFTSSTKENTAPFVGVEDDEPDNPSGLHGVSIGAEWRDNNTPANVVLGAIDLRYLPSRVARALARRVAGR